ncbi:hypothetical protein RBH26_19000 [Natronolimnohabitans sp. A-GB9]|uniref:hypothetical protein n=1 Tax=Natronolimnohabitans sp. A-GB9 TaxID=3069757 RepID=UPI0027B0109C|nr:hypothetical protein [Natronolimnohabitans sp. A-GB9]MDQ2052551.1 hypothetical protein [Natronolimnohabitans sp. A-GB9]
MLDRTGRVVFGSLLALALVLTGSVVVEEQFGVGLQAYPFLSFLVFAGIAIAVPQLYLAATDEGSTRSRVQFATVGTAVFAVAFAGDVDGIQYLLIATAGAVAVIGLVCYELLRWHRITSDGTPTQTQTR